MPLGSTLSFDALRAKIATPPKKADKTLGRRHIEVARLIASGMRRKQIAATLGLTLGTVRVYVSDIYEVTGLSSQVDIANWVNGNTAQDICRLLQAMGVAA